MKKYVLRISTLESEHPLGDVMLFELGFDAARPLALVEGVGQLADLLRMLKTPEKVRDFMKENQNQALLAKSAKILGV